MPDIRTVEFNSLPQGVRERFVAITNGTAAPTPLFSEKTSTQSGIIGLGILFVLLAGAAVVALSLGIGDLYNDYAIHGPLLVLLVYVPVAFLLFFLLLTIVRRVVVSSPFPFQPGRYLFPSDFVDARTGTLRIVPIGLMTDFKGTHMHTNGVYTHTLLTFTFQGATEQFSIRGQDIAQAAINAFADSQRTLASAAQAQDLPALASLDPFFACRRLDVWETDATAPDTGPRVKTIPAFFRWRAAVAAIAAIVLALPLALGRNFVSDEMLFADAKKSDTEDEYGRYLRVGWRHLDEAKLAQPIAAFREAKKEATVSKMRRILKTYYGSSVEPDARAELRRLYAKTFSDFSRRASSSDARMLPFMKRLLDYLEKNDTATVRVLFSPPSTGALAEADAKFQREHSGAGKTVEPISPYFGEKSSWPREQSIVSRLNTAFASIFPTDVLTLEASGKEATPAKEPSVSIVYAVGPSGRVYTSDDGARVFVGIDVAFAMRMRIPNDPSLFDLNLTVSPPERFGYRYQRGGNQAEAAYNAMADRAFDEFTSKLQAVFFRNPPAPASDASSSR